jgi:2-haloacid dehalogenase
VGLLASTPFAKTASLFKIRAIAFDAFAVLDPRPVFSLAETLFPERGLELSNEWRTRQFEYTWLRTLSGRYADFWNVTEDALNFAAKKTDIDLSQEQSLRLMNAYLGLKPWPDVVPILHALREEGIRMALLSNFTEGMLISCIKNSGLNGIFERILSTDQVKAFKPDPRAYGMGVNALNLSREEILFVAFAGWDAAGSKIFGYPTYWVNRFNLPPEELGAPVDGTGIDLKELLHFIRSRNL